METTAGAVLLALYVAGIPLLLRLVARNGRPGVLRSHGQIEVAMLVHIAMLLTGGVLLLLGLGVGE